MDEDEDQPTKRVTRGRQINFLNSFLLSEDEESLVSQFYF